MVNTVCFDKTGTLTENELELNGIVIVDNNLIKK
jgi:P-type E1-E2 ATPase